MSSCHASKRYSTIKVFLIFKEMDVLQNHVSRLEEIVSTNLSEASSLINQQALLPSTLRDNVKRLQEPHAANVQAQSNKLLMQTDQHAQSLHTELSALSDSLDEWKVDTQIKDVQESIKLSGEYQASQKALLSDLKSKVESNVGLGVTDSSYFG